MYPKKLMVKKQLKIFLKLKLLSEDLKRFFINIDLEGISFQIDVPKPRKNVIDH